VPEMEQQETDFSLLQQKPAWQFFPKRKNRYCKSICRSKVDITILVGWNLPSLPYLPRCLRFAKVPGPRSMWPLCGERMRCCGDRFNLKLKALNSESSDVHSCFGSDVADIFLHRRGYVGRRSANPPTANRFSIESLM